MPDPTEQVPQNAPAPPGLAAAYELNEDDPAPASPAPGVAPSSEGDAAGGPAGAAADAPRDPATGRFLPRQERPADAGPRQFVGNHWSDGAPAAPAPAAPASPLRRLAEDFGIDHAGLADESVEAAVRAAQRTLLRLQETEGRRADLQRAADPARPQATAPQPGQPHPLADDFEVGLTAEESGPFDPEFVKALNAALARAVAPLRARLKAAEQQVGYLTSGFHGQVQETNTARIDRALAALADPRLGTARRAELADDDPLVARRAAVVAHAAKLAGPKATIHQVCAKLKAARDLFYGEAPAAAPAAAPPARAAGPTPAEWAAAALRRPTHRAGAQEPNGVAKAVQAVADLQRELGGASAEPDSEDDFPG